MHYLAPFILIYCQLQLRLSLWLKGAPRDPHLEQRSENNGCATALLRHGPKNG
jgi:hypothetical protein